MAKGKLLYLGALIALYLAIFFLFRNEASILETIGNYASLFIIIILLFILFLGRGEYRSFPGGLRTLYVFWQVLFIWMLLVPFIFSYDSNVSFVIYEGMYHDYRYLGFFSLSFLFISNKSGFYRDRLFQKIGGIALVAGIIAILIMDKSFSAISNRSSGFTLPYYLWWIVMWVYPYLFLKYLLKDFSRLGLWLFVLHVLLSLLFLKRAGLVDAGMLVCFYFIFSGSSSKRIKSIFKSIFIGIVAIFIGISFFSNVLNLVEDRFYKTADNLKQWDRNIEVLEFFTVTSEKDRLIGFGANNYLKMTYIGEENKPVNALHIGAYNLIYKGGYLYVGFLVLMLIQILSLRKYLSYSNEIRIGFIMGLVFLIGHAYQFSWSYNPEHFFWLVPILRAIYLKGKLRTALKT